MTYKHYILLRFNQEWNNYNNHLNRDWMHQRFELFEKYMFQSLLAQTNQNFEVLFALHPDTAPEFVSKAFYMFKNADNFSVVMLKKDVDFKNIIQSNTDYVITTRLDNDDMVHKNFIDAVQQNFIPIHKLVLNPNPVVVNYVETNEQFILTKQSNQFTSLVEEAGKIETIYFTPHPQLIKDCEHYKEVFLPTYEPLACFNVHKTNTCNLDNRYENYRKIKRYLEFKLTDFIKLENVSQKQLLNEV
ncbi:MAG: glycosyltransferase [Candidatus Paceibacterota bacterium]|jgi:hypothetical protein